MRTLIALLIVAFPCAALAQWDDESSPASVTRVPADSEGDSDSPSPSDTPSDTSSETSSETSDTRRSETSDVPRTVKTEAAPMSAGKALAAVAVPRDPGANEAAAQLESALRRAIEDDGRLEPIDLFDKLGGNVESAARPGVEGHIQAGRTAFDNLELETAASEYQQALKLMLAPPNIDPDAREIARVCTLIGASYLLNADTGSANLFFRRGAIAASTFTPDESQFSPDIIEAFLNARSEAANGKTGNLTITSTVAPSIVILDGADAGVAPVRMKDLPAGDHHVVVKTRGYEPWVGVVTVTEDGSSALAAEPKAFPEVGPFGRAVDLALTEMASQKVGMGARDLAGQLGVSYLIIASVRSEPTGAAIELEAYDMAVSRRAAGVRKLLDINSGRFDAEVKGLAKQLVQDLLNRPVEEPPSESIVQQWWFWPAVGGAAAVIAGAAVYAYSATSTPEPPSLFITGIP